MYLKKGGCEMAVSDKVKAILTLNGHKQTELAAYFGITPQSMNNKMNRDSWSAKDLVRVADFVGGRVAVILNDGQTIFLDSEEKEKASDE